MQRLTRMQERVLGALRQRADRGHPVPTYRELCREFGWRSTGTVRDHLRALARKGFVQLTARHRDVRLSEDRPSADFVPLVGRVVAGVPVISEQNIEHLVPVPREWIKSGSVFALRVAGDSMRDAGIIEGDEVIVRQTPVANDGEIVVATVDGETTIKRLRLQKRRATLFAENPAYRSIELTGDAVIQGVVVGLLRSYQKKPAGGHTSSRES